VGGNVRLRFDDDHGEGAPHFIEPANVPGDGLFDFLHRVSFHPGDDVIDAIDDIDVFDVCNLPELLQEVLFSP
jgi:hypothetical protein